MICKNGFIKIIETLEDHFNGETADALNKLGISESRCTDNMDVILGALDQDVDPNELASSDVHTAYCGSFIGAWLFGNFKEFCPTPANLYDYIVNVYSTSKSIT